MTISARLLSSDSIYSAVDEFDVKNVVQAIDMDLEWLKVTDSKPIEGGRFIREYFKFYKFSRVYFFKLSHARHEFITILT